MNETRDWRRANQAYLDDELQRLRQLLLRRVMWLRCQWQQDPLQRYQGLVISDDQVNWLLARVDHRVEESFYQDDSEAFAISQSVLEMGQKTAEQRLALEYAGTPLAIDVLVRLFGLTAFEENVLLLCLAPELDPSFAQLYAYVQDDVNYRFLTPHLALTLFGGENGDWLDARDSFLPGASLRRFRLVDLESDPSSTKTAGLRALKTDERIVDYLRGIDRLDERIAYLLRPMQSDLLAPHHHDLAERLASSLERGPEGSLWTALNFTGPSDSRKSVARKLCDILGLGIYDLNVKRLPVHGPERRETVRLLERDAVLSQFALYLDTSKLDLDDRAMKDSVDDLIECFGVFIIVGSEECWNPGRNMLSVHVPKPDADAQRQLWRQALAGLANANPPLEGFIDDVVQQFDFGPDAIAQAVAIAKGHASLQATDGDDVNITSEDLWQACREHAGRRMEELAQHIVSPHTWGDIVLPKDVFSQLEEIASQVAYRARVYEDWGFGARLGRGRGIGALFSGSSGTGKTMAAEVLANYLKLDLYRIDLAGVVSKYIGETEKNLKKVFDAAEQSGAILFFDEADALFGKRTEVKDSHDRYANIEVNYLLQRMEDYRGLAILATNRKSALDRAFLRRLRFLVDFPFPDAESRRNIWKKVFPPLADVGDLDYDVLSRLEIPGGNIKNIALNAAFLAASEGSAIEMNHVMHAVRREYTKVEKMVTESEFGQYYKLVKS